MTRRDHNANILLAIVLTDLIAIAIALLAAYFFRFHAGIIPVTKGYRAEYYAILFPCAVTIWLVSFYFAHMYEPQPRVFTMRTFVKTIKGSVLAIVLVIAGNFFVREAEYSRLLIPIALIFSIGSVTASRFALERFLMYLRLKNKLGISRVLIVGTGQVARLVGEKISQHPQYGLSLQGYVCDTPDDVGQTLGSAKMIGTTDELSSLAKQYTIDQVLVAQPGLVRDRILTMIEECEREFIELKVVPDLLEMIASEISVEELYGIPFFSVKATPLQGWNLIVKRVFDAVVSGFLLVMLSPVILVLAILIKRDSSGSVFYKQERIGLDGKRFLLIKFRTMIDDAEHDTGPVWAKPNDPRITRIGRWLRAYDLDELPQLLNVLRGDMSLVGPRPERPFFVEQFKEQLPRYMARHNVKSGITGWAQVNGYRQNSSITQRLKYDLFYVKNWSLWFDVKILLMTLLRRRVVG
jgi:exopolysaccharide biosynthesis polyprenyl glycosylphosphotransferase